MAYNGAFGYHTTILANTGLTFKGSWDANANNPFLQSGVGVNGEYYIVSVAGNTNLDGTNIWHVGDWAIFVGATNMWQKIANSNCVTPNPQEIYVDGNVGNDITGNGGVTCPYKTIQHALTFTTNPLLKYTLILATATYTGVDAVIPANVSIEGNGATIQFNLTLGSVGLAGTDQQPFYVTCGFQEFTFDLSPFSICLPTFDNCSINKLIRTDTAVGPYVIRFSDGSIIDFSVKGNVAFDNTLLLQTGTVETGGTVFLKNTIVGVKIDLQALSTLVLIASVFIAPTGIINALDPSAIVNIDSTSASGFGGSIIGTTNINYLDNAQTIKYNPTTPTDWAIVPTTVQEGLDYVNTNPAYTTVQEEGTALTQRRILDFQGLGVSVADDNINNKTVVTVLSGLPATAYGLYSQTSSSTPVTATTVETTLIGSGVGTLSVPANGFFVGGSFKSDLGGTMSAKNNDTLRFRIKSGSVILADSGPLTMPAITNQVWSLTINFTIRQIGGTGVASIATLANFLILKLAGGSQEGYAWDFINNTTFDTTIPNTLDITAEWSSSSALNSIYSDIFVLNKIY